MVALADLGLVLRAMRWVFYFVKLEVSLALTLHVVFFVHRDPVTLALFVCALLLARSAFST